MSYGFLMPEDFSDYLADNIDEADKAVLATMKHTRIEPAYRNRKFIVYEMVNRLPREACHSRHHGLRLR
jgi:hypothetical protein